MRAAGAPRYALQFCAIRIEPLVVCLEDAANMLGVPLTKFQTLVKSGWLAPAVRERNITLYDVDHIRLVWERIKREGWPVEAG